MPVLVGDLGSLHDPGARVVHIEERVLRLLDANAWAQYHALSLSGLASELDGQGLLVRTHVVDLPEGAGDPWVAALEHEAVPVVSYPFEWTFTMLQDAALLHLDLVERALDEGLVTKDGTPYNILFVGSRPVFVDLGSLERQEPGEGWYGYRQFCQLFLNPLLIQAYAGVPFQPWLRGAIRGITPGECAALLSRRTRMRPSVFPHVAVQAWADRRYARSSSRLKAELKAAGLGPAVIRAQIRRLRRLVSRLGADDAESMWSGYGDRGHYPEADLLAKEHFVELAAADRHRNQILDLGANDGRLTEIALRHADYAVAVDSDPVVVDRLYRRLRQRGEQRILPLFMDLADPSGGIGWAARQRSPFDDRVTPGLVLCLALIHHLAITESIPMEAIVAWLASFEADVVIEFARESDPMVRTLCANKQGSRWPYSEPSFLKALATRFEIVRQAELPMGTRMLYHVRPRH